MANRPNFDDTSVAFQTKNDRELYESYLVFKSLGIQPLVNFGTTLITKALDFKLPITPLVRYTIFKQFCGGVDAEDCFPIVERMGKFGVQSILDYSVEAREDDDDMDAVADEVCATIYFCRDQSFLPFAVFKCTGIMPAPLLEKVSDHVPLNTEESESWRRGLDRFERICRTAAESNIKLLIDAEESWIQPAIDQLAENAMAQHNNAQPLIYNTLQMYRWDRFEYLKKQLDISRNKGFKLGIKLVRGAYMEKERERALKFGLPSPIQPDKLATDKDFDAAVELCIKNIDRVGVFIGTHNEASTLKAVQLMKAAGISNASESVYFSQLYGMSDHISFNLASKGYLAAKYLPYGPVKSVLPYLFRRAQENSSIQGQAGRELQLIEREIKRRKSL